MTETELLKKIANKKQKELREWEGAIDGKIVLSYIEALRGNTLKREEDLAWDNYYQSYQSLIKVSRLK